MSDAKAHKPLTPVEHKTVAGYVEPTSPTYNNQTQSYIAARNKEIGTEMGYESAVVTASRLFGRANVHAAVTQALESEGKGYKVRVDHIARAAMGETVDEVITEQQEADDTGAFTVIKQRTVVKRPVPHTARVQYHKLLMELTGDYDRAKALGRAEANTITKATRDILRRNKKRRDSLKIAPQTTEDPHQDVVEAEVVAMGQTGEAHDATAAPDDSVSIPVQPDTESPIGAPSQAQSTPDDKDSQHVSFTEQGQNGGESGGRGESDLGPLIPSPSPTSAQKISGGAQEAYREMRVMLGEGDV